MYMHMSEAIPQSPTDLSPPTVQDSRLAQARASPLATVLEMLDHDAEVMLQVSDLILQVSDLLLERRHLLVHLGVALLVLRHLLLHLLDRRADVDEAAGLLGGALGNEQTATGGWDAMGVR